MKARKSWLLIVALLAVVVAMVACTPKPTKYAVTVDETITNGVVTVDQTEATAGTVITVTVDPAAGYKLKDNTLKANFEVILMTEGAYTFTMPEEDVEITAQFERIKYEVNATTTSSNGTVSVSQVRAIPGTQITVTPMPAQGYEIGTVTVNGTAIEAVNGLYTFTMPEGNAEVEVDFVETRYGFTIEQNQNVTVTADTAEETLTQGTVVTLSHSNLDEKFVFVNYLVNGEAIAGDSFTMPAEAVTVTAQLRQVRGENLGNANNAANSYWTYETDTGAAPAISLKNGDQGNMIWHLTTAQNLYFETKVNVSALTADGNPTAGIVIKEANATNKRGYFFHIKVLGMANGNEVRIMPANNLMGYDYQWSGAKVTTASNYAGNGNYATLAVAKLNGILYCFYNGECVYVGSQTDLGETIQVGFKAMGVAEMKYYDYSLITDASAVEAKLGASMVTSAAAPAWTNGLTSVGVQGTGAYADKGVTFYAQKVDGGVKVAAVAKHSVYKVGFAGGDWWQNTGLEMRTGERHLFLTANAWANDDVFSNGVYTFFDGTYYNTVAQGFIPDNMLTLTNGVARLAFAWKTPGDKTNNGADLGGNETDWWMPKGSWCDGNLDNQFYVHASGVSVWASDVLYNVVTESNENVTITADKAQAHATEQVTVTVEIKNDLYTLKQILVNGVASDATFAMPEANVTVTVELQEKDNGMFGASVESSTAPTAGWNLDEDKKGNKLLTVSTQGNEYIFLKEVAADFYFETKLNITSVKTDDGNPTTGIVIKKGAVGEYFYVRAKDLALNEVRIMRGGDITNFGFDWSGIAVGTATAYTGENAITLAVAKYGLNSYFFLNGTLVYTGAYTEVDGTVQIGMMSMGVTEYKYFDYSFIKTASEVEAKIGAAMFTAQAPAWTNGLETIGVTGSGNFEGKGVTYYAKRVDGGVKVAVVATHSKFTANVGNWWENTNFEMFSGQRDGDCTQFWANPRLATGGEMVLYTFATVFNPVTNLYTTVVDGFLPEHRLNNKTADGTPRIGFAWKTIGDETNNGRENNGNNADYWVAPGGDIGTASQQYYIYDTGISKWASRDAYTVTAKSIDEATVSTNLSSARAGMQIVVTVTVTDAAYELDKILVNGVESEGTFTMPAQNIEVTATVKEKDEGMFGYSANSPVQPSSGWDLSLDKQGTAKVSVNEDAPRQLIFLKETPAEFYFEAKLNISRIDANDGNPTTGIVVKNKNNAGGTYFFVRAIGKNANSEIALMRSYNVIEFNFGAWHNMVVANAGKEYIGENNFITLAVAKRGMEVYYYLNGELAFVESYPDFGTEGCQIGLMSMGVFEYSYYDYSLATAGDVIDTKLGSDKVTSVALPEWTNGLSSAKVESTGEWAGKSVEFYAQVVEGGVRVAAIAHHGIFGVEGEPREWHRTTNFEMFSGGTQYFIAAAPAKSGNIQAISITTVYDASTGLYTTVMEGFISNIAIDNGVARLGFAWKTPGDVGNNGNAGGGGNDEYWVPKGHAANNAAEQFYITATGVHESAPV